MKKTIWASDLHLEFLKKEKRNDFLNQLAAMEPENIILGGDTGEAPNVGSYLKLIAQHMPSATKIYIICGNHEGYRSSIAAARGEIIKICDESDQLYYLPNEGVVELSENVGLIGADCLLGDARIGNYNNRIRLGDFTWTADFQCLNHKERITILRKLGDQARDYFESVLPLALQKYNHVVIITHAPLFSEFCLHGGKPSSPDYLPYFVCQAPGEIVFKYAKEFPDNFIYCLSGHSHCHAEGNLLKNLYVCVSGSDYGAPRIETLIIEE